MNSTAPLLKLNDLSIKFDNRFILTDVNLVVQPQEIVTLVGPNGAGKSSLLRAILGLIPIYKGHIEKKANLKIGYMPQHLQIDATMPLSVHRFLQLAYQYDESTMQTIIERLNLSALLGYPLQTLSGGERQRVLLARALANKPDLLVLDEPAQGIDIHGQAELYQRIHTVRDHQGCSILMVSHDLHMVMAGTDQVICINGHVCCSGTPKEVSQDPRFLDLFGLQQMPGFAVYTHRHTHQHD